MELRQIPNKWAYTTLLFLSFLLPTSWANAALLKYEGVCTSTQTPGMQCPVLGLKDGQSISATFNIYGHLVANTYRDKLSVTSWSINIGNLVFTDKDTRNWDLILFSDQYHRLKHFQFLASMPKINNQIAGRPTVDLRLGRWWATPTGECAGSTGFPLPCSFPTASHFVSFNHQVLGTASIKAFDVPEPGALLLLSLGLTILLASRKVQ